MIFNASSSPPTGFSNVTHYKFDFVVRVGPGKPPNPRWWYVSRNDGCHGCQLAIESENVSAQTYSTNQTTQLELTWQIPHGGENFNALYKCNAFGSWKQSRELAKLHDGGTPRQNSSQKESFSFVTPSSPGVYSVRLICNAAAAFAASFGGHTHYFVDLVFTVN